MKRRGVPISFVVIAALFGGFVVRLGGPLLGTPRPWLSPEAAPLWLGAKVGGDS